MMKKSAIDHLKNNRYSIGTTNEKGLQVDKIYSSLGRHKKEWKARFLETYKFTLMVERNGGILMEMVSIPVITIICYLIGEIYKVIFKNKEDANKLIPVLLTLLGGVLGVLLYVADEEFIGTNSLVTALEIGLVSGASSTTTHQIIKQLSKKGFNSLDHKDINS